MAFWCFGFALVLEGYIDDLRKIKLAELTKGLSTKIDNYRQEALKKGIKLTDGTVAASRAKIEIKGKIIEIEKIGASQKARDVPASQRYHNKNKNDGTLYDSFPLAINHAEQDNLGKIADEIDKQLGILGNLALKAQKTRATIKGKIDMCIEQKVCTDCTAGFNPENTTVGPLKQFSDEFPKIELIILNLENNQVIYIKAGQILKK